MKRRAIYYPYSKDVQDTEDVFIQESTTAGQGVFAKRNIAKNFNFGRYGGKFALITKPPTTGTYYGLEVWLDDGRQGYIDGLGGYGEVIHFSALINHSFNPNVKFGNNGDITAVKNIKLNDEIFLNYGLKYWQTALPELMTYPRCYIIALLTHNPTKKQQHLILKLHNEINILKMWQRLQNEISRMVEQRLFLTEDQRKSQKIEARDFLKNDGKQQHICKARKAVKKIIPIEKTLKMQALFANSLKHRDIDLFVVPFSLFTKKLISRFTMKNKWIYTSRLLKLDAQVDEKLDSFFLNDVSSFLEVQSILPPKCMIASKSSLCSWKLFYWSQ